MGEDLGRPRATGGAGDRLSAQQGEVRAGHVPATFQGARRIAAYVRRAAAEIGLYDAVRLRIFGEIVDYYVTSLNTTLRLRSADALAGRIGGNCRRELAELVEAARTGRYRFRPSFELVAFCLGAAGFYP